MSPPAPPSAFTQQVPKLKLPYEEKVVDADVGPAPGQEPAGAGEDASEVDWTSPDQVAAHVSKSTLAGMQQLWRAHAASMDTKGRDFAERIYHLHSQAIQDVAGMKAFELRPVLNVLNTFTASVRESVLQIFQDMRQADDDFAQGLYQTSRRAFSRNLREALEAKDVMTAERIKRLKAQHEQLLESQRRAALVAQEQAKTNTRHQVMRELREENRKKLQQTVAAIMSLAQQGNLAGAGAAATAAAGGLITAAHTPAAGGGPGGLPLGTALSASSTTGAPVSSSPGGLPAVQQGGGGGTGAPGGAGTLTSSVSRPVSARSHVATTGPSLNLEMLQAFAQQSEDDINSVLAKRELEVALKQAQEEIEELHIKLDDHRLQLQLERADISNWKDKWAQENAKTDGIKRECMQIIIKCEQRVQALQAEHMSEMSKRDYILQRAKDTIMRLEARVAELTGAAADPRLVAYDSPRFPGMTGGGGGGTSGGVLSATTSLEPSPLLNSSTTSGQPGGAPPSPAMSALGGPSSPGMRAGTVGGADKRGPRGSYSGAPPGAGGGPGGGHTPSRMLGGASGNLAPRMSTSGLAPGGGSTAHAPPAPARVSQSGAARQSISGAAAAAAPGGQSAGVAGLSPHGPPAQAAAAAATSGQQQLSTRSSGAANSGATPSLGGTSGVPNAAAGVTAGIGLAGAQGSLERVGGAASHSHSHLRKPDDLGSLTLDPSFTTLDPPPAPGGTSSRPASGQGHVPSTPSTPLAPFPSGYSGPGSVRGPHHH